VLRTGRSARVDEAELDTVGGPDADVLRLRGFLYQVGSPVVVEGELWGAILVSAALGIVFFAAIRLVESIVLRGRPDAQGL